MISRDALKEALPKPFFKRELLIRNQTTDDIINEILKADELFADQYQLIANYFNDADPLKIGSNIYQFLKKNVRYVIEREEKQTSTSPAMLMHLGRGDCKHYSLFTGGILKALGIPYVYRFASYNIFNRDPQHVYVVMYPGSDKVIIDAVWHSFNSEKTYIYKVDKKPKMSLTRLSGLGKTKAQRKAKRAARKAAGKGFFRKLGKKVVKIGAAPARNAFLLLLKINAFNLAMKLDAAKSKDEGKLKRFWEKLGGNYNVLKRNINMGSRKKKARRGVAGFYHSMGVLPAAAATVATPILVAVANLLKELGITPGDIVNAAQTGIKALADKGEEIEETEGEEIGAVDSGFIPAVIAGILLLT